MKSRFFFSIAFGAWFALNQPNAAAYIDPGSGSMILQALLALVFGAILTIRVFWQNLKFLFFKMIGRHPQTTENSAEDDSAEE